MLDLINPFDHEAFKETFLSKDPFPHFCIDNFLKEDFAEEVYQAFPNFQEAQSLGREFSAVNEKKKVQVTEPELFPPAIRRLHELLASKEYVEMWSNLTGIDNLLADPLLVGGGIHETNTGGHLDVHVDFNYIKDRQLHRRMNILIYFNKDWKEEYGGYFDIWDKDVKKRCGYFEPKFNRACGFLTSDYSFHGVTPITCPPHVTRKSFATYYYTKEAPENWQGETHSTLFKARPTEWVKGSFLMPYEKAKRSAQSKVKNIKNLAKKIIQ